MPVRSAMFACMLVLLSACAVTPPFSDELLHGVNLSLNPEQAVKQNVKDTEVMWGGVIVNATNTPDHTDFAVLYYPLDSSQRPDRQQPAKSRFIVRYPGYLETMVYAPGREITVLGKLQGVEDGKIGGAPYRFAVLEADRIHLWPVGDGDSRVRFGVGVGIGVHM
ncbi:MAG: Slp family lipoprotein [Gammaproteobacteria bacterium]|jgi:outer membrane lipoprotein